MECIDVGPWFDFVASVVVAFVDVRDDRHHHLLDGARLAVHPGDSMSACGFWIAPPNPSGRLSVGISQTQAPSNYGRGKEVRPKVVAPASIAAVETGALIDRC